MDIVVNFENLYRLLLLPADQLMAKFFISVGWIPIFGVIIYGIYLVWVDYRQGLYADRREFMLLAIDVPTANEQGPKAVEQMFAHLAGAHSSINLIEKYWDGKTQDTFSFEIVSIEGYTQFIIRTEKKYRDFIESIIYAQYGQAEIAEVEDYAQKAPDEFPDENYNIWGGEWTFTRPQVYPFKTYIDFEDKVAQEFKDPMAVLMELFGGLRKGEQCWLQFIIKPTGFEWEAQGAEEISKVIGEKKPKKMFLVDRLAEMLSKFSDFVVAAVVPEGGWLPNKEDLKEVSMINLKPAQKKAIEAIQQKVSKIGFEVKTRFLYFAENEIFDKTRGSSFVGYMKQFSNEDLNALKPDMVKTVTTAVYLWTKSRVNARKRRLISAYKNRSAWQGLYPQIYNIEELATLWHFPVEEQVTAPMLQKVTSRKSEAPSYLPVEGSSSDFASDLSAESDMEKDEIFSPAQSLAPDDFPKFKDDKVGSEKKASIREIIDAGPPSNLPIG
ncbi:MAG: hypothetical protein Q8Q23_06425 [bacterium]|nr:hypothetical protein [bacterium]